MSECLCSDAWNDLIYDQGIHAAYCPDYQDCGGWTWDPPCGGCDRCILDQHLYYDETGLAIDLTRVHMWEQAQAANA